MRSTLPDAVQRTKMREGREKAGRVLKIRGKRTLIYKKWKKEAKEKQNGA